MTFLDMERDVLLRKKGLSNNCWAGKQAEQQSVNDDLASLLE